MSKSSRAHLLSSPVSYTLSMTPALSRVLVLGFALLISFLLLNFAHKSLQLLEDNLGVWAWQLQPELQLEQRLVIVAIDEASLQEVGAWPWSRHTLMQLSNRLKEAGVSLQAFDLVLPEARDGDEGLQNALQKNNAILAQIPLTQPSITGRPSGEVVVQSDSVVDADLGLQAPWSVDHNCRVAPHAQGFLANHAQFSHLPAGHIAVHVDDDGAIRQQAALYCYQGKYYPSLALATYLKLLGVERLRWGQSAPLNVWQALWVSQQNLYAPDSMLFSLPVNERGMMQINYQRHPNSFTYLSAAAVLKGDVPEGLLNNRVALIGATAFGLGDIVPTPHSGVAPGVELQARMIVSLLDQQVPYVPKGQWLYQLVAGLLSALVLFLLAARAGQQKNRLSRPLLLIAPLWLPLVFLSIQAVALVGEGSGFNAEGEGQPLWLGWLPNSLFAASGAVLLAALEYLRSRHERQRLYDNLSRYLPEPVASEIALLSPTDSVEAKQQRFIVMCADLRNFSCYQQQHSAEETAQLLHQFFSIAGDVVGRHEGVLYELHADSLLAVWSLPNPSAQDNAGTERQVINACQAALRLYQSMEQLDVCQSDNDDIADDVLPLGLGVGLSAGLVTAGSLGCAGLRSHMLLGQPVSFAVQLQKMTQELAYPILLDQSLAGYLNPEGAAVTAVGVGRYLLEGSRKPKQLYSLKLLDLGCQVSSKVSLSSVVPFRSKSQ